MEFRTQLWPWACMHHAMYHATGDPHFLDESEEAATETNVYWFRKFAAKLGYGFFDIYVDTTHQLPTPRFFWEYLLRPSVLMRLEGRTVRFILEVQSATDGSVFHWVTAEFVSVPAPEPPHAGRAHWQVYVYDSILDAPLVYQFKGFVRSPYSQAFAVHEVQLLANIEEFHPKQPGPYQQHVPEEQRNAYLATLLPTSTNA
jgi:hypothetical protein